MLAYRVSGIVISNLLSVWYYLHHSSDETEAGHCQQQHCNVKKVKYLGFKLSFY